MEENDYTVLTFDDLEYELGLAEGNIRKKIAFVENQVGLSCSYTDLSKLIADGLGYTYQYHSC